MGEIANMLIFIKKYGAPGEIRTPDHQVRSLVLYPTELRAHICKHDLESNATFPNLAGGERGIRTLDEAFDPILP